MKYLLLFLLLVAGCMPSITKGRIASKEFVPAYETTTEIDMGEGVKIPITNYHPDAWYVTFENTVENHGKVHRTVQVSKAYHDECKIGGWFDMEPKK